MINELLDCLLMLVAVLAVPLFLWLAVALDYVGLLRFDFFLRM